MNTVVLVVDDDLAFLAVAARVVSEMGVCTVLTALDPVAALRTAREHRPDAILVDVGLPEHEGIELAGELTGLPWSPRVVLTSTDPDAGRLIEPRQAATIPFVPKEELANGSLGWLLFGE